MHQVHLGLRHSLMRHLQHKSDSVSKANFIAALPVILIKFKSHISQRDYRLDMDFLQTFWRSKCYKNTMHDNEYTFFKK